LLLCDKLEKRLKENGLRVRALHPERYLSEGIVERAKTLHGALCFCVWYIFALCVCNNISPVVTANTHTEQQNSAPASEIQGARVELSPLDDISDTQETQLSSYAEAPFKHGVASPHNLKYAQMRLVPLYTLSCVVLTFSPPHTFVSSGQQTFDCGHGLAAHREKTEVR